MQNLQIVGSAKYLQNLCKLYERPRILCQAQGLIMLWMKSEVMTLSSCHHTALSPWPAGQCPQWGGGLGQLGKIPLKIQQCSINSLMRTLTLSNPILWGKSVPTPNSYIWKLLTSMWWDMFCGTFDLWNRTTVALQGSTEKGNQKWGFSCNHFSQWCH